jgi:hypothetical protein
MRRRENVRAASTRCAESSLCCAVCRAWSSRAGDASLYAAVDGALAGAERAVRRTLRRRRMDHVPVGELRSVDDRDVAWNEWAATTQLPHIRVARLCGVSLVISKKSMPLAILLRLSLFERIPTVPA